MQEVSACNPLLKNSNKDILGNVIALNPNVQTSTTFGRVIQQNRSYARNAITEPPTRATGRVCSFESWIRYTFNCFRPCFTRMIKKLRKSNEGINESVKI